jgi:hypothetical protein
MAETGQLSTALEAQALSAKTSALPSAPTEKLSGQTPAQAPQPTQSSLSILKDMFYEFILINFLSLTEKKKKEKGPS